MDQTDVTQSLTEGYYTTGESRISQMRGGGGVGTPKGSTNLLFGHFSQNSNLVLISNGDCSFQ